MDESKPTPVMFRFLRRGDRLQEIVALFPTIPNSSESYYDFAGQGQYGSFSARHDIIYATKPADPEDPQVQELFAQVKKGWEDENGNPLTFKVYRRWQPQWNHEREVEWKGMMSR